VVTYLFKCMSCIIIFTSIFVQGDELILNNGEKLIGKVITLTGGKLVFQSQFAGKVNIVVKNIKSIETADRITMHFIDGTVLESKVVTTEDGMVKLVGDSADTVAPFTLNTVSEINPSVVPAIKWTGDVKVGISSAHGNTTKESGNSSFSVKRKTEESTWASSMRFLFSRDENTDGQLRTIEENITLRSKYDGYFNKKDYGFLSGSYKKDHIADLDRRVIVGFGAGRKWVKTSKALFMTDFGLAFRHEMFEGANGYSETDDSLSAHISYKVTQKFTKSIELFHKVFYYPSYEDLSDYYFTSSLELRNKFTGNLFGALICLLDYDATPAETADSTDIKYLFNLGFTF